MKIWKPCKQCKATGYTGNFRVCPRCKGRGFVILTSDAMSQYPLSFRDAGEPLGNLLLEGGGRLGFAGYS